MCLNLYRRYIAFCSPYDKLGLSWIHDLLYIGFSVKKITYL